MKYQHSETSHAIPTFPGRAGPLPQFPKLPQNMKSQHSVNLKCRSQLPQQSWVTSPVFPASPERETSTVCEPPVLYQASPARLGHFPSFPSFPRIEIPSFSFQKLEKAGYPGNIPGIPCLPSFCPSFFCTGEVNEQREIWNEN